MRVPPESTPPPTDRLPAPRQATSPLWRIWLPLVVASLASSLFLARLGVQRQSEPHPVLRYQDMTATSGLSTGATSTSRLKAPAPATVGGGVVAFDSTGNGMLDLYCINPGVWPWEEMGGRTQALAGTFLRAVGNGEFEEATNRSGIAPTFYGMAAAATDFNGDGFNDLVVTGIGGLALYQNTGDGRFTDVTEAAGLGSIGHLWLTGALWLDVNGDQKPDLLVMPYARWPSDVDLDEAINVSSGGISYGTPIGFLGELPLVYLNNGDGTFQPAADHMGLDTRDPATRRPRLWALAAIPLDANDDSLPDLLLTFAQETPLLFLGKPEGGFRRVALGSELRREGETLPNARPANDAGRTGDPRSQLLLQWARDQAAPTPDSGIPADSAGLAAVDLNRDGRYEAVFLGSQLEPQPNFRLEREPLFGRPSFAERSREGWAELTAQFGDVPALPAGLFRAALACDLNQDGNDDLLLTRFAEAPLVLRNEPRSPLPWIAVDLSHSKKHPSPWGARVQVHTPRGVLSQTYLPSVNGLAQVVAPLRFGLARDSRVRRITVQWTDGSTSEIAEPTLNRVIRFE